jgi:hypothetical protein
MILLERRKTMIGSIAYNLDCALTGEKVIYVQIMVGSNTLGLKQSSKIRAKNT